MKKEHTKVASPKGLHSIGKQGLPSNSGDKSELNTSSTPNDDSESYSPGTTPGMEHVESQMDELSDEEAAHGQKHLAHRLKNNKPNKPVGSDINDFANAMGDQS